MYSVWGPRMENQMETRSENNMETGFVRGLLGQDAALIKEYTKHDIWVPNMV